MRRLLPPLLILALTVRPVAAQDITLIPFTDDIYEISGLIPEGWNSVSPGLLQRADPSVPEEFVQLAQQSAPLTADALMTALLPQLGLDEPPAPVGERQTDHFLWTLYQTEVSNAGFTATVEFAVAESDGKSYLVLMAALPDQFDGLRESLYLPVIDALAPLTDESPTGYIEEEVEIKNGDVTLAGTLSLPPGDGPHPAVILLTGSGGQDRDESLAPLASIRPFRLIADYLTPLGIAVLRYDDRGVAQSTGDFASATMADFVTDAEAALAFLQNHPAIDSAQIGIMGHSEGGSIAPQIAVESEVAFVISMAGTSVPGDELLLTQNRRLMEVAGASEEDIAHVLELSTRASEIIRSGDDSGLEDLIRELIQLQISMASEEDLAQIDDIDAYIEEQIPLAMQTYTSNWFRHFIDYDPGEYWARVDVPVLALFGALDVQVDADQNSSALEAALSNNLDVQIVVFPTANHLFQDAKTGGVEEYAELGNDFLLDFLPTVSEWLLARVAVAEE